MQLTGEAEHMAAPSPARRSSARRRRARPPALAVFVTEPVRGVADLATLQLARPWLRLAARGDGHGVLVLPGLLADDASTRALRGYLRQLGYYNRGWRLGRNLGATEGVGG